MRIGYIHDSEMPGPEASTVNVAKMCAAFAANGHAPLLVHLKGSGGGIGAHYHLSHPFRAVAVPLPARLGVRKKLFSLAAAAIMRAARPAIVYGRKPIQLLPAMRLGLDLVLELHTLIGPDQPAQRRAFARMLASPRLRRIVVISQALADDLAAEWPAAAGRTIVAHDGADPAGEGVVPITRPNPGRPCAGYAGHLYPGKGMETIAALAAMRPNVDFVVLGGRPDDITRWTAQTQGQSNLFFRGMVPHADVPRHLGDCDVVLAPYSARVQVSDGKTDVARWMSPLKIFEYMAQGRAIMASGLPVIREILRDGDTAALCPPDDPAAWAERLDALLADPAACKAMGARAQAEFEAHYTWKGRAELVLDGLA
ncbi:glycosyltransferase family 4 protein [Sphingomonas canadensis]|uniref:Glycosyltransferase family 4 protein n=1 Tax=Sphingomonas canadensis TaxID=1219257 RepID=A0ABW3H777_9SPHN|nr:glycosyltransferase family 4 protein [Sphingomonas canadensis]MCW3837117.1 glycosyltransferase family 4 protein [Sphingomonas canadensis]